MNNALIAKKQVACIINVGKILSKKNLYSINEISHYIKYIRIIVSNN